MSLSLFISSCQFIFFPLKYFKYFLSKSSSSVRADRPSLTPRLLHDSTLSELKHRGALLKRYTYFIDRGIYLIPLPCHVHDRSCCLLPIRPLCFHMFFCFCNPPLVTSKAVLKTESCLLNLHTMWHSTVTNKTETVGVEKWMRGTFYPCENLFHSQLAQPHTPVSSFEY